ncbi:hypothetical protein ACNH6C_00030 [Bdellovibrio bacteriovorus]|uniref:hypothetical protein n=1 Tax=Bdellovibrio bacteriovorus TaxID=959 RepID=UPI003A804A7F
MKKLIISALFIPFFAVAQNNEVANDFKPMATGSFPDGTTVNTLRLSGVAGSTSNAVVFQIKQANGTICYGFAGDNNTYITNPSVSCVK